MRWVGAALAVVCVVHGPALFLVLVVLHTTALHVFKSCDDENMWSSMSRTRAMIDQAHSTYGAVPLLTHGDKRALVQLQRDENFDPTAPKTPEQDKQWFRFVSGREPRSPPLFKATTEDSWGEYGKVLLQRCDELYETGFPQELQGGTSLLTAEEAVTRSQSLPRRASRAWTSVQAQLDDPTPILLYSYPVNTLCSELPTSMDPNKRTVIRVASGDTNLVWTCPHPLWVWDNHRNAPVHQEASPCRMDIRCTAACIHTVYSSPHSVQTTLGPQNIPFVTMQRDCVFHVQTVHVLGQFLLDTRPEEETAQLPCRCVECTAVLESAR